MLELNIQYFYFLTAGASIGALVVLFWCVLKLKKYRYFKGVAYRNACKEILEFSLDLDRVLSNNKHISEEDIASLREKGASAADFFKDRPYSLPRDIEDALDRYSKLEGIIKRHRQEVDFAIKFLMPFYGVLEKNRYISYKEMNLIVKEAEPFIAAFNGEEFLFNETATGISDYSQSEEFREKHNMRFVEEELETCRCFFDTLSSYPLDRQQRECCVVDDDSALVVAGAGSGKTTVIMSKVAYLIKKRGIDPSRILLISFTNKSAKEMTERIKKCIGDQAPEAMTFHSFGLSLLKKYVKKKYDIAPELFLENVIHSSLGKKGDVVDPEYARKVVNFFAYYFNPDQTRKQYKTLGDKIEAERAMSFETLRMMTASANDGVTLAGEKVKSLQEAFIANFLFLNSVRYEYESKYKKEYEDDGQHRAYRPDFYLPDYDIYIEHYGVDDEGEPPDYFSAPDKLRYKETMEWKRALHAAHNNKYVESYSWWDSKGVLFKNLEEELKKFDVVFSPKDMGKVWESLCEKSKGKVTEFERLIASFINLFKANGFTDSKFDEFLKLDVGSPQDTERQKLFLEIARRVFNDYQNALDADNTYDFSDMINKATDVVNGLSQGNLPYKYVIVDEYQDASVARMRLLKAVVDKTDAHLFCVGDDWQSIYRFAGSDINLFTDFSGYFGKSVMMKIENTYRNSQNLIDIMGNFIMKNPDQIGKVLKSPLRCEHPIGFVIYSEEGDGKKIRDSIGSAIDAIVKAVTSKVVSSGKQNSKILLLGRTKFDADVISYSKRLKYKGREGLYEVDGFPQIECQFLTVHRSKGIEGDFVILLNARDDLLGFPNLIADDPIIQLLLAKAEAYPHAEERRLFYVALTRTRNSVYVLVPEKRCSPFVRELSDLGVKDSHFMGGARLTSDVSCPKCKKGQLILRNSGFGEFMSCSNYPQCDYKISGRYTKESRRCKICGNFMVERRIKNFTRKGWYAMKKNGGDGSFWGCANYPHCTYKESV